MAQVAVDLTPIRDILAQHAHLTANPHQLAPDSCLHDVGLTSLGTVNLMLALENHFDIEFPDTMLSRRTFESLESIAEAVGKLVR